MVYVDLLVIQDLIMNYLVILSTGILLNRVTKFHKVFLSSVTGTIPIIFLFLNINKILILIILFFFAIIMSMLAFKYNDLIYTLKNCFYMYLISIFIAGSIYLINTMILPSIDSYILNVVLLIFLTPIITTIYIKSIKHIKVNYSNYYKVDIYFKDKPKIAVNAFLDTGNLLSDPYNHKPIILVSQDIIDITNEKIILVPYQTIDNQSLIKCFSPQKIYIDHIGYRKRVLIGLIDGINIEGANCLLNKKLLERN